jgi:hypothetical protein
MRHSLRLWSLTDIAGFPGYVRYALNCRPRPGII